MFKVRVICWRQTSLSSIELSEFRKLYNNNYVSGTVCTFIKICTYKSLYVQYYILRIGYYYVTFSAW